MPSCGVLVFASRWKQIFKKENKAQKKLARGSELLTFSVTDIVYIIKPTRSAGFSQIKKIPYQAPLTQLGPQKCTFWKNAFLGPKYKC